jgi:hypothetical protein
MNTPEAAIWIAPQRWHRARAKHQKQCCCEERNGDEKREAEDDRWKSPCGGQQRHVLGRIPTVMAGFGQRLAVLWGRPLDSNEK